MAAVGAVRTFERIPPLSGLIKRKSSNHILFHNIPSIAKIPQPFLLFLHMLAKTIRLSSSFRIVYPKIKMSQFCQKANHLQSNEIHVKLDQTQNTASLTFKLLEEMHTMNRAYDEILEKTLNRFAITCRSKLAKASNKAARSAQKKSKGADFKMQQNEQLSRETLKPQPAILLCDGVECNVSLIQNHEMKSGMKLLLDGTTYEIVVNPPTVATLSTYPRHLLYVGCPIVPQVTIEFGDEFDCQWESEVSPGSGDFGPVGFDKYFVPTAATEGCRLKLFCAARCKKSGRMGRSVVFYLSGVVLPAVLPVREFNRMISVRDEFNAVARMGTESDRPLLFEALNQNNRENVSREVRAEGDLRIVTYNILAEPFATSDQAYTSLYPYCDKDHLQSEYRIQRILAELIACDADVICLQECDLRTFEAYLLPLLGRRGYEGHFTCKGSTEGCAVFTYQNTTAVISRVDLPLKNVLREAPYLDLLYEQRPDLQDIIGGKLGTVAQITVLRCVRHPDRALVIANTHLFYHPLASFLRVIQCYAITQALEILKRAVERGGVAQDFVGLVGGEEPNLPMQEKQHRIEKMLFNGGWCECGEQVAAEGSGAVAIVKASAIFCGDLNSSPNIAAIQFLRNGVVTSEQLDHVWEEVKYFYWGDREANFNFSSIHEARQKRPQHQHAADTVGADRGSVQVMPESAGLQPVLQHSLGFISASGYPEFSNYTPTFQQLLDYIMIPEDDFNVVRVAECPSHEVLGEFTALPSAVIPSDHIAIAVDLSFKD